MRTAIGGGRRARLHRRLAGVAALVFVFGALFTASSVASHRRLGTALHDVQDAAEVREAVLGTRVLLGEAEGELERIFESLPLDLTAMQSSGGLSFEAIQASPRAWADLRSRRPGALPAMRGFLDTEDDAMTQLVVAAQPDDPRVLEARAEMARRLGERERQLDDLAADLAGEVEDGLRRADEAADLGNVAGLGIAGGGALLVLVLSGALARTAARQHRAAEDEDRRRTSAAERSSQERAIQNGLDMAQSEEGALDVMERAIRHHASDVRVDVLLADSSRSHFSRGLTVGGDVVAGCEVTTPEACPALVRGHRVDFDDNRAVDACPHLPSPALAGCRATCIPMSIAGSSAGVLHVARRIEDEPLDVALLETMAREAADRIGVLRAFARSEAQAATDPLTGLLNRRSLEDKARRQLDSSDRCTVAFGDLDHFKRLNDIHGHDTGDRALRLFARVLGDEVRPGDLVARYGGEEFVVVLLDCDAADALNVLHRVHTRLMTELVSAGLPPFTVSFGVAEGDGTGSLADLVARADLALLQAKRDGRDCDRTYGPVEAGAAIA